MAHPELVEAAGVDDFCHQRELPAPGGTSPPGRSRRPGDLAEPRLPRGIDRRFRGVLRVVDLAAIRSLFVRAVEYRLQVYRHRRIAGKQGDGDLWRESLPEPVIFVEAEFFTDARNGGNDLVVPRAVGRDHPVMGPHVPLVEDNRIAPAVSHDPTGRLQQRTGRTEIPFLAAGTGMNIEIGQLAADKADLQPHTAADALGGDAQRFAHLIHDLGSMAAAADHNHLVKLGHIAYLEFVLGMHGELEFGG